MYEAFYGLREKPFALIPDPDYLYLSKRHKAALSILEYGLTDQAGFVVISGEVGSGKTTLVRRFVNKVGPDTVVGMISYAHKSFGGLLEWVLLSFGLDSLHKNNIERYKTFVHFLTEQYVAQRRAILIIDEAQNLDVETLEELRVFSNINAEKGQFIQIVLVGQPELMEKLNRPDLRQFAQRVSVDYKLLPLGPEETRSYIRHRLSVAGGSPELFDEMACAAVHFFADGTPRLINILCDTALVYGFAADKTVVDLQTILDVIEDKEQSELNTFKARLGGCTGQSFLEKIETIRNEFASDASEASSDSKASTAPGERRQPEPDIELEKSECGG